MRYSRWDELRPVTKRSGGLGGTLHVPRVVLFCKSSIATRDASLWPCGPRNPCMGLLHPGDCPTAPLGSPGPVCQARARYILVCCSKSRLVKYRQDADVSVHEVEIGSLVDVHEHPTWSGPACSASSMFMMAFWWAACGDGRGASPELTRRPCAVSSWHEYPWLSWQMEN